MDLIPMSKITTVRSRGGPQPPPICSRAGRAATSQALIGHLDRLAKARR